MVITEWWGHSPEHGWVVVDRSLSENKGRATALLFFRCRDGEFFSVHSNDWRQPAFMYTPLFLEAAKNRTVAESDLAIAKHQFKASFLVKYEERRVAKAAEAAVLNEKQTELRLIQAEEHTKQFLLRTAALRSTVPERHANYLGLPTGHSVRPMSKVPRASHCYNCHYPVDNRLDLECTICGWIICNDCVACGCGYSKR